MTDTSSSNAHLSAAMTTTDEMQITRETIMTSSSSRDAELYFQCAALVIGIVGTATNALILYAMVASKQHKKHVLIFNQNVLDLVSCVLMIITYSIRLSNIYLRGTVGYLLCTLVFSESLMSSTVTGSIISLVAITIERYLKIVHSAWSQKHLRKWMTYSAMTFSWLAGITYNLGSVFPTTVVIDGTCYAYAIWENEIVGFMPLIIGFIFLYIHVLLIFIFCYWRILVTIRRQAAVMASHGTATASIAGQTQSQQIQSSVIKTMILVCAFYAISHLPNYLCIFILALSPNPPLFDSAYYASVFLVFLYTTTNPFIYVAKFDPVRKVMLRLFTWKKPPEQSTQNVTHT